MLVTDNINQQDPTKNKNLSKKLMVFAYNNKIKSSSDFYFL
jgi:hypothetical protein